MVRHMRLRVRHGVTILELLLVIAILLMLAAMAYPSLSAWYMDTRVKAAADQVREAWTEARAHAIESGQLYRFAVQPGTGLYRVAPDAEEYWDGSASGGTADDGTPIYVREDELSNGIVFNVPADFGAESNGWVTVVVFNPDGSCQEDREIALKDDDDASSFVVRVRAMTGAITVRREAAEGQ
jgi:prepilin-type N-terminal cleavage/methylation domain-containing protein